MCEPIGTIIEAFCSFVVLNTSEDKHIIVEKISKIFIDLTNEFNSKCEEE